MLWSPFSAKRDEPSGRCETQFGSEERFFTTVTIQLVHRPLVSPMRQLFVKNLGSLGS